MVRRTRKDRRSVLSDVGRAWKVEAEDVAGGVGFGESESEV